MAGGGGGQRKKGRKILKKKQKNSTFKPLSTISVPCMKIQGEGACPPSDAHGSSLFFVLGTVHKKRPQSGGLS